jgi:hypothetical protein
MAVSVLRPSRVHGTGASQPREWVFVKRALDGRRRLLLARGGRGANHPTAAPTWPRSPPSARPGPGRASSTAPTPTHRTALRSPGSSPHTWPTRGPRSCSTRPPPPTSAITRGTRCRPSPSTPPPHGSSASSPSAATRNDQSGGLDHPGPACASSQSSSGPSVAWSYGRPSARTCPSLVTTASVTATTFRNTTRPPVRIFPVPPMTSAARPSPPARGRSSAAMPAGPRAPRRSSRPKRARQHPGQGRKKAREAPVGEVGSRQSHFLAGASPILQET